MTQDVETDKKTTVQIGSDILEGQMKADRELSCESTTDEIQAVCCSLAEVYGSRAALGESPTPVQTCCSIGQAYISLENRKTLGGRMSGTKEHGES
jgi:hypothetical protein